MMINNRPIGIFDSGVGGTSIWKEIQELLPHEDTIYLSDSKNAPYGSKTASEIVALSVKNTEKLLSLKCKIIVVACNTATTNAIKVLRSRYDVPIIGIEPAIKPAALKSSHKAIGILATRGTLSSELFAQTSKLYTRDIKVVEVVGTGLVELIESGKIYTPQMFNLLQQLLKPMLDVKIDYLVLGCSHYPYLIPVLEKIFPPYVKIIDSGEAVAKQTRNVLDSKNILNNNTTPGNHIFYTNADPLILQSMISTGNKKYQVEKLDF